MCSIKLGAAEAVAALPNPNWYAIGHAILGQSDSAGSPVRITFMDDSGKESLIRGVKATEAFDSMLVLTLDDRNTIVLSQWFRGTEHYGFGWSQYDRKPVTVELL